MNFIRNENFNLKTIYLLNLFIVITFYIVFKSEQALNSVAERIKSKYFPTSTTHCIRIFFLGSSTFSIDMKVVPDVPDLTNKTKET